MSLRLCKGGSQITFSQNIKCCIPYCEMARETNRMLPLYTFPVNVALCKEWLEEIKLDNINMENLDKLHTTHVVCSKHFKPFNGGMRLYIDKNDPPKDTTPVIVEIEEPPDTEIISSVNTQTFNDDWIKSLIDEFHVEIVCGKFIQCRVCASTSVQAVCLFNKHNKQLHLENIINNWLPIKVKPTDTKPLNVCVHCIFKLRQFIDLFNCCQNNDKAFNSKTISTPIANKNINLNTGKKPNTDEIICISDSEDENDNTNKLTETTNNLDKDSTANKCSDKSKLNEILSNPIDFMNKKIRKHKIKILISTKANNLNNNESSTENQSPNNKVIDIEFEAEYIICHGKEWIYEITVYEDQLNYSQQTNDHILKVISSTMNKECEKNNSKVIPLPISPMCLDRVITSRRKQTETIVIVDSDDEENNDVRKKRKADEMLKKSTPLKKSWVCAKCGLKLNNKKKLNAHIKTQHPKQCRICGENVIPEKLLAHEKEHSIPSADGFICHLCGCHLKTYKSLNCHYKQHQKSERHCCTKCNLQFANGFLLRKHLRQHHKDLLVKKIPENIINQRKKCAECNLWLSSRLALQVHMRTHLPIEERKKTCPECNKVFINARRFKMHVETHGPCPVKCPECPRSFPRQEHLDNHLQYHKVTEPVYCETCQQHFKSKTTLKNHIIRVHQGVQYVQKTFPCIFCKITFITKEELKIHTNQHTFEEKAQAFTGDEYGKMKCSECNKSFLFKSRLTLHKMYHHNHPCLHCGKPNSVGSGKHQCKPRGSRALQFCCQYCSKRFSSKQRLNLHERTHGLEYRYQCSICYKWFTKMSALKLHSYTHSNTQQYTCNICGKVCKLIRTLKKHISACHNVRSVEDHTGDPNLDNFESIFTLPILDNDSAVSELNLPINLPISLPIIDEQDLLIYDVSNQIEIPNPDLERVDIEHLENFFN